MTFKSDTQLIPEAIRYFRNKVRFSVGPTEVHYEQKKGTEKFNLIDVRDEKDFDQGHVPGAVNLSEDDWECGRGLSKDRINIIYCYGPTCHLAARAALKFLFAGFTVTEMVGGFEGWQEAGLPIESEMKQMTPSDRTNRQRDAIQGNIKDSKAV